MSTNRHEPYEELISASLTGDLSADERALLDAHLDECATCRATLASFSDQRRIVAGMRHVAPPADLGARVRAGVEGGSTVGLPWWRRPPVVFASVGGGLAAVAGALLALVLLNGGPDGPPVGEASASPSASVATSSNPVPSDATAAPTATPVEATPAPTAASTAAPTPIPTSPEPDLFLALTGELDNQLVTVRSDADTTVAEVGLPAAGPPIAAELSPDGAWLAHIVQVGESGLNEVRVTRLGEGTESASEVAVGESVVLGESVAGSPFLEQLFWSPDSRQLAFTLADPDAEATDVWVFRTDAGEASRLTDAGEAYAGSWTVEGSDAPMLWVSRAGETPRSYLVRPGAPGDGPIDPEESAVSAANVFQPLVSPNGSLVIYWEGRMERSGAEWTFREAGQPLLADIEPDAAGRVTFSRAQPVFTDVTVGREGFRWGAIAWGLDSDAFAVWDAAWTGLSQAPSGEYPSAADVYYGYATDPRHITQTHAIDDADIPDDGRAVDVKVPATGRHLVITIAYPRAGVMDPPRADLVLVTRNTGDVPDEVQPLEDDPAGWYGPAAYDDVSETEAP